MSQALPKTPTRTDYEGVTAVAPSRRQRRADGKAAHAHLAAEGVIPRGVGPKRRRRLLMRGDG